MDTKQKQRIIGIIFLVVLAVVAVPAFLKRAGDSTQPGPRLDGVSTTGEEALSQQGSPSAMPVEPMGQEQNSPPPQPMAALPSEPLSPPTVSQQPVPLESQPQPLAGQPFSAVPTPPTPNASQQLPLNADQAIQKALPIPTDTSTTNSQEPRPAEAPAPASPPVQATVRPETKPQPSKSAAGSVTKSAGTKTHKQAAHVEKSNWNIRLAIFSVRANAEKLLQALKKQGYKASIEEINTYKGMTYKVTLLTKGSRAEVDKLATKLNTQFHISVIVNRSR